ncbi:MAG: hypothetical protein ABJF10_19320 [Chthoniobacter sp.]|uniref:hypothetical protein n=1 Tax=Chthoniobacter sp. TaxID=2510640 RepID=UPI0032A2D9BB
MPLREVTCPHCFREVFVNTDALCPACRGNVNERSAEHENLTLVEFVDGEALPPVCVVCGKVAHEYVLVGEKNETRELDGVGVFARIMATLGGLMVFRIGPEPKVKEYRISVKLPVCMSHRESRTLKPTYVDYDSYRITIPANREFIRQWKKA